MPQLPVTPVLQPPVPTPGPMSVSSPIPTPVATPTPPPVRPFAIPERPVPPRRDTVASIALPDAFQKSCLKYRSYPSNYTLKSLSSYPTALKVWRNRLKENATDMFLPAGSSVDVPYRDLNAAGSLDKRNMFTTAEVDEWLGLQESDDMQNTANEVVSAIKADPKCRLIFFWGPDDQAHLNVTKDIVTKILTYHQVMPVYIDFMSVFGECTQERDLRFSGFREQNFMAENRSGLSIHGLRRSGKQFQLCYNLKCVSLHVENKEELGKNEWRVRQAAVHHQFDVLEGTTLWVVTMGSLELQKRSKELTLRDQTQEEGDISSFDTSAKCFSASLETHLVYCHWATEDWRGYIRWMESMIEKETVLAMYGPRGDSDAFEFYGPGSLQSTHRRQDKINESIMVLEGNVSVMLSLCKFYTNLKTNRHFPKELKDDCSDDITAFVAQVEDMVSDLNGQIARATVLLKITNDRKELIGTLLQDQSTRRMERMSSNMEKEAVVVRIITIVTLIYLPATFVSTFFSTDIIKYQNPNGGTPGNGNFSNMALNRWLQVTFPLTLLTFLFAWTAWRIADGGRLGEELQTRRQTKKWREEEKKNLRGMGRRVTWGGVLKRWRTVVFGEREEKEDGLPVYGA